MARKQYGGRLSRTRWELPRQILADVVSANHNEVSFRMDCNMHGSPCVLDAVI
jgi:hypothetical protein